MSKVKVKVTKNVKNTIFAIPLERNVVERSALAQNVHSELPHRPAISPLRSPSNQGQTAHVQIKPILTKLSKLKTLLFVLSGIIAEVALPNLKSIDVFIVSVRRT